MQLKLWAVLAAIACILVGCSQEPAYTKEQMDAIKSGKPGKMPPDQWAKMGDAQKEFAKIDKTPKFAKDSPSASK